MDYSKLDTRRREMYQKFDRIGAYIWSAVSAISASTAYFRYKDGMMVGAILACIYASIAMWFGIGKLISGSKEYKRDN